MDESEVHRELELKGLQPYYDRIVEQLASLDQKAQAMIGLEGLLLALMAVFSSSIPNNQPARAAVRSSMASCSHPHSALFWSCESGMEQRFSPDRRP